MCISGGWGHKVESRLLLMKEDTTLYHLIRCFRDRVSTAAVNQHPRLWETLRAAGWLLLCPPLPSSAHETNRTTRPHNGLRQKNWQHKPCFLWCWAGPHKKPHSHMRWTFYLRYYSRVHQFLFLLLKKFQWRISKMCVTLWFVTIQLEYIIQYSIYLWALCCVKGPNINK